MDDIVTVTIRLEKNRLFRKTLYSLDAYGTKWTENPEEAWTHETSMNGFFQIEDYFFLSRIHVQVIEVNRFSDYTPSK